jgi:mannan endo-1,4-beta-mannosidase
MTQIKELTNLIWVWDVQDLNTDFGGYNPGAEYFDLAALDVYGDAYSNDRYYNELLKQVAETPVAIGECFDLPPGWALDNQPLYVFFMNWAYGLEVDLNGNPTNSIDFIKEVYNNPRVLTRDEMPGWD